MRIHARQRNAKEEKETQRVHPENRRLLLMKTDEKNPQRMAQKQNKMTDITVD